MRRGRCRKGDQRVSDRVVKISMKVHCMQHSHGPAFNSECRFLPEKAWDEVLHLVRDDKVPISVVKRIVRRR